MSTERRHHFEWNKIKKSITELILESNFPVNEPDVSEFLSRKYGEFDRSTVNKHMRQLVELGCFESAKIVGKGTFIFYDIKTVKNLQNINSEFKDIKLKDYPKAKNIVISENFPGIGPLRHKEYFIYMSLFPSLFDVCFNNAFESMLTRASELWKTKDYDRTINRLTDQVYERLFLYQINSNRFLDPLSEEIPKEEFKKLFEDLPFPLEEPHDKREKTIIKFFIEKLKQLINSKKIENSDELFNKLVIRLRGDIEGNIYQIKNYQNIQSENISERIIEHFHVSDILNGNADPNAKTFVAELKKRIEKINSPEMQTGITDYKSFIVEWYEKCQKNN